MSRAIAEEVRAILETASEMFKRNRLRAWY